MSGVPAVLANDAILLLTATIWGFAFVAQRMGMEHVGPLTFTALRFALGAATLTPLLLARGLVGRHAPAGADARAAPLAPAKAGVSLPLGGLLAGAVLFFGSVLQQAGLVTTSAGKAGFITGLYVVLVPLAGLAWGQRAGTVRTIGALLAAVGLYLLSVTGAFTVERGDLLVLAGAFFWTAHVLIVGWVSPRTDALGLAAVQFTVCAALSAVSALLIEPVDLSAVAAAGLPIAYGGVLSVGVAFTLQVVAQRRAPPAHAAILLALESPFAALGGWLILGERLAPRALIGAALMFAGMLCSQLPLMLPRARTAAGRRAPESSIRPPRSPQSP